MSGCGKKTNEKYEKKLKREISYEFYGSYRNLTGTYNKAIVFLRDRQEFI